MGVGGRWFVGFLCPTIPSMAFVTQYSHRFHCVSGHKSAPTTNHTMQPFVESSLVCPCGTGFGHMWYKQWHTSTCGTGFVTCGTSSATHPPVAQALVTCGTSSGTHPHVAQALLHVVLSVPHIHLWHRLCYMLCKQWHTSTWDTGFGHMWY